MVHFPVHSDRSLAMSEAHEALEHAEHAQHNSLSSFDRRVAVSIAIVAACLAGVAMFGHRKHNEVLSKQADSNRYRTEAATAQVEKSNQFAWYQAKRQRQAQSEGFLKLSGTLAVASGQEAARKDAEDKWAKDIKKYDKELPEMEVVGKEKEKKAKNLDEKADQNLAESHHAHDQAELLDYAHLCVELGVVLCSICILTKKKSFWIGGIVATVLGLGIVAYALTMMPHHADHPTDSHDATNDHKDDKKHEPATH